MGRTPKLQTICAQLSHMARELGPDAKMPTAIQLRDATGVSMATLNTALGELEKQQIITRKHGVGIFVSEQLHQKNIALICDANFLSGAGHSPFYDLLLQGVQRRAQSHNEQVELHFAQPRGFLPGQLQQGLANDIHNGRIQGVIGVGLHEDTARWLRDQNVPFVSFFGPAYGERAVQINYDRRVPIEMALDALESRGCRKVAFWNFGEAELMAPFHFQNECGRRHLTFCAPFSFLTGDRTSSDTASAQLAGHEFAHHVLSLPRTQWPDGVFIANDMFAHGALMVLQKHGVTPGEALQIVTHSNKDSQVFLGHQGQFDLLEFDPNQSIETIFHQLENLMEGQIPLAPWVSLVPQLRTF